MAPSPKSSDLTPLPGEGRGEDEVELGFISGIFGLKGEVRVHLHNRESDFLSRNRRVILVDARDRRFAASLKCRPGAGKRIIGRVTKVDNREDAAALKDWKILVSSAALPKLEEGEFYVWRVIDLPAVIGEEKVGSVVAVHSSGPIDIFEIATADGPRFVPALNDNLKVDLDAGRVELAADALEEG